MPYILCLVTQRRCTAELFRNAERGMQSPNVDGWLNSLSMLEQANECLATHCWCHTSRESSKENGKLCANKSFINAEIAYLKCT